MIEFFESSFVVILVESVSCGVVGCSNHTTRLFLVGDNLEMGESVAYDVLGGWLLTFRGSLPICDDCITAIRGQAVSLFDRFLV